MIVDTIKLAKEFGGINNAWAKGDYARDQQARLVTRPNSQQVEITQSMIDLSSNYQEECARIGIHSGNDPKIGSRLVHSVDAVLATFTLLALTQKKINDPAQSSSAQPVDVTKLNFDALNTAIKKADINKIYQADNLDNLLGDGGIDKEVVDALKGLDKKGFEAFVKQLDSEVRKDFNDKAKLVEADKKAAVKGKGKG
jgi:hypothetical protein